jgi:hypothetical protein
MLHKCANTACLNLFRHLSLGKLFHVEQSMGVQLSSTRKRRVLPRMQYFWLCDDCAPLFTLIFAKDRGMIAVPLHSKTTAQTQSAPEGMDKTGAMRA